MDKVSALWDVDEASRFIRLASSYPNLLNYEEETLRKIISTLQPFYDRETGHVIEAEVEKHWGLLKSVASGVTDREGLEKVLGIASSSRQHEKRA